MHDSEERRSCARTVEGDDSLNFHISSEIPIESAQALLRNDEITWITLSRTINDNQKSNSQVFGFYLKNGRPEYIRKFMDKQRGIYLNNDEETYLNQDLAISVLMLSKIQEFLNEFIMRMESTK